MEGLLHGSPRLPPPLHGIDLEQIIPFKGLLLESQGQDPVLTVLYVPYTTAVTVLIAPSSLDSRLSRRTTSRRSSTASTSPRYRFEGRTTKTLLVILPENSSSQGHNLALTGLFVPNSLASGDAAPRRGGLLFCSVLLPPALHGIDLYRQPSEVKHLDGFL